MTIKVSAEYVPQKEKKAEKDPFITTESTLIERGSRYGKFSGHAQITQAYKVLTRQFILDRRVCLTDSQQEALDMIFHKIGRILNGDPNYADSWHDIAGYASLVDKQLNGLDM
jgi:hypothetical protein